MGALAARLVTTLYSQHRSIFHFREAAEILGGRTPAANALAQLIDHGIAMRLTSGKFTLIPYELGFEREYLGNPYIVARELAQGGRIKFSHEYYLSYGSAFQLHQMITQPQLIVYVSTPRSIRPKIIQGTEFRFVHCKSKYFFGITEMWVDKNEKINASDLEHTLLDGLKLPAYCGGLSEVAKAFSIKHNLIQPKKIISYALKLNIGAVYRRLGYLMELYQIGSATHWEFLRAKLTNTYQMLDPDLPSEGRHLARWRLKLNIPEEELQALRGT